MQGKRDFLMKTCENIGLLAANTSRTRAYLAAFKRSKLIPSFAVIYETKSEKQKLGQADVSDSQYDYLVAEDDPTYQLDIDYVNSIESMIESLGIEYVKVLTDNINSTLIMKEIQASDCHTFIYSGYGGQLVSDGLLELGVNFLHVHGGFLPDFPGSTANYYSILSNQNIGASAIFLTNKLDAGPLLNRQVFDTPKSKSLLDHKFDGCARAEVLISTLKDYEKSGSWNIIDSGLMTRPFFVIHPVLKHIAILS